MKAVLWCLISVALLTVGCRPPAAAPPTGTPSAAVAPLADGTQRMVERLRLLDHNLDRDLAAGLIVDPAIQQLRKNPRETQQNPVLRTLAEGYRQLVLGDTQQAIALLSEARKAIEADRRVVPPEVYDTVRAYLGIAWLRLGEQGNCVARHTADSCLVPIQGGGVYADAASSEAAMQIYLELLADHPDDMTSRWLLNVAAMTAGGYPDKVPAKWRIPPAAFASQAPMPRFADRAPALGLDLVGIAGGVVAEDFDGDGWIDLLLSRWNLSPQNGQLRYFHNNGDGTFSDRTAEAGLTGITGGLNMVQADFDNDGHPDVLVLRGGWLGKVVREPLSLLRNRGDGTFEDVTEKAGLRLAAPTQVGCWADYDNDGWLDLFVGYESVPQGNRMYATDRGWEEPIPCALYHNNRDGTFTDVAHAMHVDAVGVVKGAAWGDYDNDGRPDLLVAPIHQPKLLFHNNGPDRPFTEVGRAAAVTEPEDSFPVWFFDYDNDGWLDVMVASFNITNITGASGTVAADYLHADPAGSAPHLHRNRHDGTFTDVSRAVGLVHPIDVMGANFGDIDNDGFPDVMFGTGNPDYRSLLPKRLLRNDGGRAFLDVTTAADVGHLQKGHGIAFADFNNDGQTDIYCVFGGMFPGDTAHNALFANPGNAHHWIGLALQGVKSNRSAIGARLHATVRDADQRRREIYGTVSSGGSFGASPLRQTLGLGDAAALEALEVRWPSGTVQRFAAVGMDRIYTLREGDAPVPLAVKPFAYPSGSPAASGTPPASASPPAR